MFSKTLIQHLIYYNKNINSRCSGQTSWYLVLCSLNGMCDFLQSKGGLCQNISFIQGGLFFFLSFNFQQFSFLRSLSEKNYKFPFFCLDKKCACEIALFSVMSSLTSRVQDSFSLIQKQLLSHFISNAKV